MRRFMTLTFALLAVLALPSPGHFTNPPSLPEVDESVPVTILSSDNNCDVVGTSWCLYPVNKLMRATKNGAGVSLTFNSITNNTPHTYHIDTTWNVDLTPLGLRAGDVIVWKYYCQATSGPDAGTWVIMSKTSVVQ